MDSLIAVGTSAAFIYGIYAVIRIFGGDGVTLITCILKLLE